MKNFFIIFGIFIAAQTTQTMRCTKASTWPNSRNVTEISNKKSHLIKNLLQACREGNKEDFLEANNNFEKNGEYLHNLEQDIKDQLIKVAPENEDSEFITLLKACLYAVEDEVNVID